MDTKELAKKIEAILFFKGEPLSPRTLARFLGEDEERVREAIGDLKENLRGRGVCLLEAPAGVALGTAADCAETIEKIVKDEIGKELGKAGLETLAAVLYLGPISKARIDHIRGVNSSFILRSLSVRGLVEKIPDPDDKRTFLYRPTAELLAHIGVTDQKDLPGYEETKNAIRAFEESYGTQTASTEEASS